MTPEAINDFLTAYIRSLSEETRSEIKGPRHGFDHIIYEIAQAENLIPIRLPFLRQGEGELAKPKKEPEHGVDAAFISRDGKVFTVFVLKDEVLSYRNWTEERFDYDLRRARDQDLTVSELESVTQVRIVLAYNKDDTEEGVESFDRFVSASGTKIGDHASLRFERWNLTAITERVREKLLSPSLLPESFFRHFTYLCWQVGDFIHGSPQWQEVLLPDWREFLTSVLAPPVSERSVRLVSVALIILRSHGRQKSTDELDPSFETGWIDLLEWAVLALWNAARETQDASVRNAVFEVWLKSYIVELERYYSSNIELLATEHSIEVSGGMLQEGASTYIAHWHLGRLGILAMAAGEFIQGMQNEAAEQTGQIVHRTADWIVRLLNANPSCTRPLLDIHHIEIFLVWRSLVQCGRWNDALNWFHSLFEKLLYRRLGKAGCRVIDYGNSWEGLFEFLATDEVPYAGFGKSSYLLLMLMELCLGAPDQQGESLADVMHRQLIHAENGERGKLPFKEQVHLMGWIPPADWRDRILAGRVDEGVSLPAYFSLDADETAFPAALRRFIENSRKESSQVLLPATPPSALVLACQKHVSALPSEFWRGPLFGAVGAQGGSTPSSSA
jgi:hypothetical protein